MAGVKEQFGSTRRDFIRSVAGAVGAIAVDAPDLKAQAMPTSSSQKKPNFVFFLGEGVRWDEFSFAGNKIIHTPNIDRLAHEGMVFRNAFVVNALCLPSRASILTGLYSHTTGAVDNRDRPIPPAAPVISDLLRAAGYDVAFIGKSHVKGSLRDRYWDYYFGFDGQAEYYSPTITEGVRGVFGQPKKYDGNYVEDLLLEKALNYLNQPHDRPFCLFLWFYAPHAPFYRPRRLLDLYNGVPIPKPATFDDDLKGYLGKPRAFVEARNKIGTTEMEDDARSLEELVKDHYAGVVSNDEAVGKVVQVLEDKHALDDTAILFSSDHGFFLGEWRIFDKRFMHEPSIRVPLIIRYPRMIRPGTSIGQMALNLDLAPSILELAGIPIPIAMQGKSLVPFLNGARIGCTNTTNFQKMSMCRRIAVSAAIATS